MKPFEELPAIVELFGHAIIAGYVTEEEHFGTTMLRVDVPAVGDQPSFTKFYGQGAIYAITPTDEKTMTAAVQSIRHRPISLYISPERQLPERASDLMGDDDFDEEDW